MNRKHQFILSTCAASALVFTSRASAQTTPTPTRDGSDYAHDRIQHARRAGQIDGAIKSSDVIGMTVNNYLNESLGKVEDLAVDLESGRIVQVILSTGGFIGIGDTQTPVPPGALFHDVVHKDLHLDADKEKLKNAPKFEMSRWAECCDSSHLSAVYRHYGEESAFKFIHNGDGVLNGQKLSDGSTRATAILNADGTWGKEHIADKDMQCTIPASRLGQIQQITKLVGMPVKNMRDEKLGKIENVLVDLPSGRIVVVILSAGTFLEMPNELSAVPPTAFRFTANRDTLQLDVSKETLTAAPHFKPNQWPNFSQRNYTGGVYQAYKVEPYFTSYVATGNNDRALTERTRNERNMTPFDQGNSQADVDTTAQIRKEIIAGKDMSMNARNVKVITNQGRVTLRGQVNSADEKRIICEIANRIVRSENVDDQLEVKSTTSGNN